MYSGIAEATRLTRAGRLSEATALIRKTLARGPASEAPQREADTSEASESADRPAIAAKVRRVTRDAPFVAPRPSPITIPLPTLDQLRTRRPAAAPADLGGAGQWLSARHAGAAGSRDYKLYVPSTYHGQAMPLVVMLHGCTQNPDDFAAGTGMNGVAEADGFFVAYPAQARKANTSKCWNWFDGNHQQRDGGEPAIIARITREVMERYNLDASRVYVAGLSAGGAMAAILGATYPDLFAAVAVHSGLPAGCAHDLPSALQAMQQGAPAHTTRGTVRPAPLILFHGDGDPTVHPRNADHLVQQWTDGQTNAPAIVQEGQAPGGRGYTREVYRDDRGQAVVERWTIHGAGHAWSGGNRSGSYTDPSGPDASREFARFFKGIVLRPS